MRQKQGILRYIINSLIHQNQYLFSYQQDILKLLMNKKTSFSSSNYRNIVKNYTHLPDSSIVQNFFCNLVKSSIKTSNQLEIEDLEDTKSTCFIVADDYREALLTISLCFTPQYIIEHLSNSGIQSQILIELEKKVKRFIISGTPLQIFEHNAKEYGSQYPFYRQKIFSIIDDERSKKIFLRAKQSVNLHGVKIRLWPQSYENKSCYHQMKRANQKEESQKKDDTTYLLIGNQDGNFIIGILFKDREITTERWSGNQSQTGISTKINRLEDQKRKTIERVSSSNQNKRVQVEHQADLCFEQKKKSMDKFSEKKQFEMKELRKKDKYIEKNESKDQYVDKYVDKNKNEGKSKSNSKDKGKGKGKGNQNSSKLQQKLINDVQEQQDQKKQASCCPSCKLI